MQLTKFTKKKKKRKKRLDASNQIAEVEIKPPYYGTYRKKPQEQFASDDSLLNSVPIALQPQKDFTESKWD